MAEHFDLRWDDKQLLALLAAIKGKNSDPQVLAKLKIIEAQGKRIEEGVLKLLDTTPDVFFSSITSQGITTKGEIKMAELREGQRIRATVALKTKGGNPAAYEKGTEAWVSSDPAVASVTVDPADPLQADVDGLNGAANTPVLVTFTADGDPDAGETRDLVATLDVVVTQGEAVVAEISAGAPTDIT